MTHPFLKAFVAITAASAVAYCLKRFSDELVVYVSPDDVQGKNSWTDF